MKCFMFPGQPFSSCGVFPDDRDGAQLAWLVRRVAGFDPGSSQWLHGEGSRDLQLQLEGVAHSLHRLRRLRSAGVRPDLVAEHSMGIYPGLVACGSIDESCCIEITFRVGALLAGMRKAARYAAACVVGLPLEPVAALARNHAVHLANCNTSRQFLLTGQREPIAQAVAESLAAGAYSARSIECDAPVHSPLVAELEPRLQEIFSDYRYAPPACGLMNHLDQKLLGKSEIAPFLLRELSAPVYWERCYLALRAAGVRDFLEVGDGESLKKFNRWIAAEHERDPVRTACYLGG